MAQVPIAGWRCRRVLLSLGGRTGSGGAFGDLHGTAILARCAGWRKQDRERTCAQAPQGGCCLRTVPCGRGMWRYPHHADGHCRTAADLMANLALRRPPATARPSRRDHLRRGPAVFRGECERGAARPGVRAATGSARWPPLSRVGGCHGGRQFARRHGRVLGADRFFAGDSVSAGIAGGAQINHSGVLSGTHPVLRAVVSRGRAHAPPHGRLDMYGLMIH